MHSDLFDPRRGAPPRGRRGWDPTLRKEWSETEDWFFRAFPAYFVTGLLAFLLACFASLGVVHFPGEMVTGLLGYAVILSGSMVVFALLPAHAAYSSSRGPRLALRKAFVVTVPGTAFVTIMGLLPLAGASPFAWGVALLRWEAVALLVVVTELLVAIVTFAAVALRVKLDAMRAKAREPRPLVRSVPPPPVPHGLRR